MRGKRHGSHMRQQAILRQPGRTGSMGQHTVHAVCMLQQLSESETQSSSFDTGNQLPAQPELPGLDALPGCAHQYGRMAFCPPMSQTFSLKPSRTMDLMLKPCGCATGSSTAARQASLCGACHATATMFTGSTRCLQQRCLRQPGYSDCPALNAMRLFEVPSKHLLVLRASGQVCSGKHSLHASCCHGTE